MTVIFGGARGFVHLPMIYLLTKGRFFQRLFCIFMQMLNIGVLLAFSKLIAMLFMKQGSAGFWNLYIGIAFIVLTAYVMLTAKFGKWFVSRLFITDYASSWLVYSLGAMVLFAVFFDYLCNHKRAARLYIDGVLYVFLHDYPVLCHHQHARKIQTTL